MLRYDPMRLRKVTREDAVRDSLDGRERRDLSEK